MKQAEAVNQFLAGCRVAIAKFVAHRYKEVQNKAKKVVGIVNLYEVQCADGKAPTVQTWCPRSVQTVEQASSQCPCTYKDGQKLVIEFVFEFHAQGFLVEKEDRVKGLILGAGRDILLSQSIQKPFQFLFTR